MRRDVFASMCLNWKVSGPRGEPTCFSSWGYREGLLLSENPKINPEGVCVGVC